MTPQHGWNDATILLIHGGLWEEASMPVPYPALPSHPVSLMAGSTGCSVSVRIALALPDRERLLLAWPATAGDPAVDSYIRKSLTGLGASEQTVRTLLDGQTLRGVTDAELSTLEMPISVPPSIPAIAGAAASGSRQRCEWRRRLSSVSDNYGRQEIEVVIAIGITAIAAILLLLWSAVAGRGAAAGVCART
jgi:hypothetical protein